MEIMTYKEWANALVMLNLEGPSERSHRVSEQKGLLSSQIQMDGGREPERRDDLPQAWYLVVLTRGF